tara:strand:+ start:747 stop:1061 length:315 start_codon:yes stop_codon:yes gene_type:complete
MKPYRPLPDCLKINKSSIEGNGLFAAKDIPKGTNLGISHIHLDEDDDIIRLPLGGWYNCPNQPHNANCIKEANEGDNRIEFNLITIKDIKKNDEILVQYTFYKL